MQRIDPVHDTYSDLLLNVAEAGGGVVTVEKCQTRTGSGNRENVVV